MNEIQLPAAWACPGLVYIMFELKTNEFNFAFKNASNLRVLEIRTRKFDDSCAIAFKNASNLHALDVRTRKNDDSCALAFKNASNLRVLETRTRKLRDC